MNPFVVWALARLSEPSTYAGLAALIVSATWLPHAADIASALPAVGVGIAGVVAVIKAETAAK